MRTSLTTFGNRLTSSGAWISVLGTFLLIGGLIWDVTIHEGDPSLASHESVFTVDNPAHVVFLCGIALIVVGMFLFVLDRLRAQRASGHRPMAVAAVAVTLALLASGGLVAAVQTQFAAAANSGPTGHDHGATTPGGSPAPGHHATFVTSGVGCAPVGTPPTADETAAAAALVAAVKVNWSPTLTVAGAAALGYRAPKTPAASKVLTHLANRSLATSTTDLLDPAKPQALVYANLPDGSQVLAGVLFTAPIGQGPCPGGSTTLWHYHQAGATREMIHVWLFDNPTGSFSTGIGGKAGLAIAERELRRAPRSGWRLIHIRFTICA
jgi:hypothetical protein